MGIYVAFDIGNVIAEFDITIFTRKLSEITGISDHDSYFFLDHIQKMQDIGITTVAHGLEYKFQLTGPEISDLIDTWNSCIKPNEMMVNFLRKLKSEDVKIAFLSNMGFEHLSYLESTYSDLFQNVIRHVSCNVGARKPTKLFFQSFCLDHDEFTGCVFIDDIEENLVVAKRYSFKTYQLRLNDLMTLSMSQQKKELDKLKTIIINKT